MSHYSTCAFTLSSNIYSKLSVSNLLSILHCRYSTTTAQKGWRCPCPRELSKRRSDYSQNQYRAYQPCHTMTMHATSTSWSKVRMAAVMKVCTLLLHYSSKPLTMTTGGVFNLELFLPDDYPMTPPRIRFLTRIYHPNIDRLGRICLDVLKNNWSPALQIRTILLSIQALLGAPNPDDPLNEAVAKQWKVSRRDRG